MTLRFRTEIIAARKSGSCAAARPWRWAVCERCLHRRAIALVPLIIRLGARRFERRASQFGALQQVRPQGAVLQHPSWAGSHIGWEPFPSNR
jgi:hypothetical protein